MTTINPSLSFKGTCEEAFNFYKSVFGGEFDYFGKWKDMPADANTMCHDADKEKIMHISLPISKETSLSGGDVPEAFEKTKVEGNNYSIIINVDSLEESTRIFNGLSAGGKIGMPLEKTFWNAYYGTFTDKFGINWEINYQLSEPNV